MHNSDNEKVISLEKEVEKLKQLNLKNEQRNKFLRNNNADLLQENADLKENIEKRAESLKDTRFNELEKVNAELKEDLQREKDDFKYVADNYKELDFEKRELAEKFKLAVADNEGLYKENSKLQEGIEHFKWRFEKLWEVTKNYLGSYAKDGIEMVKSWFEMDTGEEIEPKKKQQRNRDDLSL